VRGFLRDWSLKPPEAGLSPVSPAAAQSDTICLAIDQSRTNLPYTSEKPEISSLAAPTRHRLYPFPAANRENSGNESRKSPICFHGSDQERRAVIWRRSEERCEAGATSMHRRFRYTQKSTGMSRCFLRIRRRYDPLPERRQADCSRQKLSFACGAADGENQSRRAARLPNGKRIQANSKGCADWEKEQKCKSGDKTEQALTRGSEGIGGESKRCRAGLGAWRLRRKAYREMLHRSAPQFVRIALLRSAICPQRLPSHEGSGGITRPCTGARVPVFLRQTALLSPDFMQYTGGKGADDEGTVRRGMRGLRPPAGKGHDALCTPRLLPPEESEGGGRKEKGRIQRLDAGEYALLCSEFD